MAHKFCRFTDFFFQGENPAVSTLSGRTKLVVSEINVTSELGTVASPSKNRGNFDEECRNFPDFFYLYVFCLFLSFECRKATVDLTKEYFGYRLSSWFGFGEDGECSVVVAEAGEVPALRWWLLRCC